MNGEFPLGLLVLETKPGFFGDKKWKIEQSDAFNIDNSQVEEFDKQFKKKEKKFKYSQDLFRMLISAYLR